MVVGMARSGTSLAAGIFARAGYHVGEAAARNIRQGDDHNPFGYFEADRLVEENRRILRAVGFHGLNTWNVERIPDEAVEAIRSLPPLPGHDAFVADWDRHAPWVWKDPHLCLTLSYWRNLVPADLPVVLVRRDPEAVYRSFRRMGWADASAAASADVLDRVSQHLAEAERTIREQDIRHVALDLDRFRREPERVAAELSTLCDVELSVEDLNFHAELDHSRSFSRFSAMLRIVGQRVPQRHRDAIERAVPRRVLGLFFPERRYGAERLDPSARPDADR
jgi:hypothetical protein